MSNRVKIKEGLKEGMGVVKEQLEYIGQVFEVERYEGYSVKLKGNDFNWKNSDIEVIN